MSPLENLNAALAGVTGSIDRAVTILGRPHPTDAQVQAAADALNSQAARLTAASDAADTETVPTPTDPVVTAAARRPGSPMA